MEQFNNNFVRLLGMHRLTVRQAGKLLELDESTLTKWNSGTRRPSFETALRVGDFFGVPADRLARARFGDLLENELSDRRRFNQVEIKIRHARTGLKAVKHVEAGKVVDVVTGKPVRKEGS